MVLANDVILTMNEWVDLLINGSVTYTVTGLQNRMDTLFPSKGVVVEFAKDGYMLPNESNFGRELQNPFVAITCRFQTDKSIYWKDKLPKSEDIGWSEGLSIRLDVWGRTPPETRDIVDGVLGCLKVLKNELWSQTRTSLEVQYGMENYVDKLEGVPDLWHRSINAVLGVFKVKEVD